MGDSLSVLSEQIIHICDSAYAFYTTLPYLSRIGTGYLECTGFCSVVPEDTLKQQLVIKTTDLLVADCFTSWARVTP